MGREHIINRRIASSLAAILCFAALSACSGSAKVGTGDGSSTSMGLATCQQDQSADATDTSEPWKSIKRWVLVSNERLTRDRRGMTASGIDVTEGQVAVDADSLGLDVSSRAPLRLSERALDLARSEASAGSQIYLPVRDETAAGVVPVPFVVAVRGDDSVQFLDSCDWVQSEFDRTSAELVATGAATSAGDVVRRLDSDAALHDQFLQVAIYGTPPTTVEWSQRSPDSRSVHDADTPMAIRQGFETVTIFLRVPGTWLSRTPQFGICTRTQVAWNSCVALTFGGHDVENGQATLEIPAGRFPGEALEVVVADLSMEQSESFVASLGFIEAGTTDVQIADGWSDGLDVARLAASEAILEPAN